MKKSFDLSLSSLLGRFSRHPDKEFNDGIPVAGQVGSVAPPSIQEMIQQYIRVQVSSQADSDGEETFEEADDFEEETSDEDFLPLTHHEVLGMDEMELRGVASAYGVDVDPPGSLGSPGGESASIPAERASEGTPVVPKPQ